jgi:hypothetical protein
MNNFAILLTIAVIGTTNLFGQGGEKCDISILAHISTVEYDLKENDVREFLSTFDKSCSLNIEYSEFSNALLFEVLGRHTQTFISVMESEKQNLEIDYILKQIANPINDGIDLKNLIAGVDRVKVDGQIKEQIIKKLKEAQAKY